MIRKGRMEKSIEVAGKLKKLGFDVPTISRVADLGEEEIEIISAEAPGGIKSAEDLASMLLDRRNQAIRDFFSQALQNEKADKEKIACRMRELGFDTPFIVSMTGLTEEEIESCAGRAISVLQNSDTPHQEVADVAPIKETGISKYEKIAETGVFRVELRKLNGRRKIYNRLTSSRPIESDYGFLLQYEDWGACKELDISRLYAVLFRLYGKPDSFFDGFKASFNYSFELVLTYNQNGHSGKAVLIAQIRDLKGYQDIKYGRSRKVSDDMGKFIDDIIMRGDLNICTMLLCRHSSDAFERYSRVDFEEFELYQPYLHMNFGYKDDAFFGDESEEE